MWSSISLTGKTRPVINGSHFSAERDEAQQQAVIPHVHSLGLGYKVLPQSLVYQSKSRIWYWRGWSGLPTVVT